MDSDQNLSSSMIKKKNSPIKNHHRPITYKEEVKQPTNQEGSYLEWSCRGPCAGWPTCPWGARWWSWWLPRGCPGAWCDCLWSRLALRWWTLGTSRDCPNCTAPTSSPRCSTTGQPGERSTTSPSHQVNVLLHHHHTRWTLTYTTAWLLLQR